MSLSVQVDRQLIRAGARSTRYVLARITAPVAPRRGERLPVNVGIVLDRSGSMSDARKFSLAREAVEKALRMLRPEDRFSLVVYDESIDVLAPSTLATGEAIRHALAELAGVEPRGSTDLCGGWLRGCEQVAEFLDAERISRCLLITDGLANHGVTDHGAIAAHARELRQRGVATSTFGVGADFDERMLGDVAHEGGGHFYFIEGASQITKILTSELGEALEITLRDASLAVTLKGCEKVEPLNHFRHRHDRKRHEVRVELGDLTSGQELDVVLRADFPEGTPGGTARVEVELHAAGREVVGDAGAAEWTYASDAENDEQRRNTEVDRAVARLYAARARAEATEANREGRYEVARRVLEETSRRIRGYAGSDGELKGLARSLRDEVPEFADSAMSVMALKRSYHVAASAAMGRDESGSARRGH